MNRPPTSAALPVRTGTVVGTLLNHRPALAALGDVVDAPPYKAAPRAPVLYVKPRNTQVECGADLAASVVVPDGQEVEVAACLGLVIGRTACRVSEAQALGHVAALVAVADLSLPHASFYRPSLRFKARDGFCPIGPVAALDPAASASLDARRLRVFVDDALAHDSDTGGRIRSAARLLADVSDFMTLHPGDVLLTGASHGAPRVAAGRAVRVVVEGLPELAFRLVAEATAGAGAKAGA